MVAGHANDLLMAIAHKIWRDSYGVGGGELAAIAHTRSVVESMNEQTPNAQDTAPTDYARLLFAVQWIDSACVTLTTSHRFAAALCATSTNGDVLEDVELPSKAFRVLIPNGILRSQEHDLEFSQINFCVLDGGHGLLHLEGLGTLLPSQDRRLASLPVYYSSQREGSTGKQTAAELLCDRGDDELELVWTEQGRIQHSPDEVEFRRRAYVLGRRLVAGLLLTLAHTTNWREKRPQRTASPSARIGPPAHRNIFIGRPLSIDARPALRTYLEGTRRCPPSVQTLVRGHHKRQVVGIARSGRKVIWVEPYWRGPEDAPILARPLKVGT